MTQLCTLVPQVLLTSRVFMQSSSGAKPHFVLRSGKSKYKCDSDCLMFKATSGICSHTLLVAVLNDEVCSFVSSFTKSKAPLNYAELAQHGLPVGGQKPSSKAEGCTLPHVHPGVKSDRRALAWWRRMVPSPTVRNLDLPRKAKLAKTKGAAVYLMKSSSAWILT